MLGELKITALLSAILLLLLGPCGVYLMSFHGPAGEVLGYVGLFALLPAATLYHKFGMHWEFLMLGPLTLYLWFMLWVALGRAYHLRRLKRTAAQ